MDFLITASFDLHNHQGSHVYQQIKQDLQAIGMYDHLYDENGLYFKLPENTFAGLFPSASPRFLATSMRSAIKGIMSRYSVTGPVYVGIGTNWAWSGLIG